MGDIVSSDSTNLRGKNRAAARKIIDAYKFMGRAYAFLRGVARTEDVALYDVSRAAKERIQQIDGTEDQVGLIEANQMLAEQIEDWGKKFKSIRAEDLEALAKQEEQTNTDGGVSTSPTNIEDPKDVFGGNQ